jgi:hypothetical protein
MKTKLTPIEWMVIAAIALILIGIIFGGYNPNDQINPLFRPREAQAQALQQQNRLKERELELIEENNRLLREKNR